MGGLMRVLDNLPSSLLPDGEYLRPLEEAGFTIIRNEHDRVLTDEELGERLPGVVATIAHGERYPATIFGKSPALKVIARYGVGWDKVDVAEASRHGVAVAMAFGANHEAVADYAIAMALALGVGLIPNHQMVVGGGFKGIPHPGFWGKTIGVIGFGRIGRAFARRCQGFGTTILAFHPRPDAALAQSLGVTFRPLPQVLAESDIVSLHLPLTPETRGSFGRNEFALMKSGAFLINTARGGIVDEDALYEALSSGHLGGAGLDVFAVQPPVGSRLLELPNVIVSPHCATYDRKSIRLMGDRCVANILAILRDHKIDPEYVINAEALAMKEAPLASGRGSATASA